MSIGLEELAKTLEAVMKMVENLDAKVEKDLSQVINATDILEKNIGKINDNIKSVQYKIEEMDNKLYVQDKQLRMIANNPSESNDFLDGLNLASATGGSTRSVNPFYAR